MVARDKMKEDPWSLLTSQSGQSASFRLVSKKLNSEWWRKTADTDLWFPNTCAWKYMHAHTQLLTKQAIYASCAFVVEFKPSPSHRCSLYLQKMSIDVFLKYSLHLSVHRSGLLFLVKSYLHAMITGLILKSLETQTVASTKHSKNETSELT